MPQGQIQEQKLEQKLQQSVSQQQLLQSQLVELPIQQLMERIETEMHDNPALETNTEDPDFPESPDFSDSQDTSDDFDSQREREERSDALDAALENIGRDDEDLPVYHGGMSTADEREDMVLGDTQSFYDQLLEQVGEMELTDRDRYVMEYLIRSLDDPSTQSSRSWPSITVLTSVWAIWSKCYVACNSWIHLVLAAGRCRSVCCSRLNAKRPRT